jgi:hypothetical protein
MSQHTPPPAPSLPTADFIRLANSALFHLTRQGMNCLFLS